MRRIAFLLMFAAVSGTLHAQAAGSLEIRGTVLETGSDGVANLPVEGAEVSLIEFVHEGPNVSRSPVTTTYTDSRGAYLFHPERTGDYYVEVRKEGYGGRGNGGLAAGAAVKLDQAHSTAQSTLKLQRPGSMTGRVVDEDGQPIPDARVAVGLVLGDPLLSTAADGTFTAANVVPGPHVVRISSSAREQVKVEPHFSPGDLDTVDQGLETTSWPGGTPKPTASLPVSPGGSVNVGAIKVRKVPYYRAHVSVPRVECEAGEKWTFRAVYSGEVSLVRRSIIPCASDFLVSNLRPGTYSFLLEKDAPVPAKWALASVDISSKNIEVVFTLQPESQIFSRVVAADGATLPPLDKLKISTVSEAPGPSPATPDGEGKFVLTGLKFPQHRIVVAGLTKDYYIKEFRLNGASSPDDTVTLGPGANKLEIVIDDKPGVIAGTVTDGDKPAADAQVELFPMLLPPTGSPAPISGGRVPTDAQGRFQINGLTPGQYRIVAWEQVRQPTGNVNISAKVAYDHAQSITVERGSTANVDLRLTDPSK